MHKFAVSNIAWTSHDDPAIFALLQKYGVAGIEIAPSKIWPQWIGASQASAAEYRKRLADRGFCVPAMQSIHFQDQHALDGRPRKNNRRNTNLRRRGADEDEHRPADDKTGDFRRSSVIHNMWRKNIFGHKMLGKGKNQKNFKRGKHGFSAFFLPYII